MTQIPETSRDSRKLAGVTPTAAGLALIDDADAAAQQTTLGLGTLATQDTNSVSISGGEIEGVALANSSLSGCQLIDGCTLYNGTVTYLTAPLAVTDGGTGATNADDARTNLGISATGSMATQDAGSVLIDGGSIAGVTIYGTNITTSVIDNTCAIDGASVSNSAISGSTLSSCIVSSLSTDLAVADGGTGASTAAAARTNLGVAPLYVTTTQAGNTAGGAETTLASYAVAGGTLAATGDSFWFEAFGSFAANGNGKTLRVRFGSGSNTLVCTFSTSANGVSWYLNGRIYRTGSATQKGFGNTTLGTGVATNNATNLNHTMSSSGTISFIGAGTSTNDVLLESFVVGLS